MYSPGTLNPINNEPKPSFRVPGTLFIKVKLSEIQIVTFIVKPSTKLIKIYNACKNNFDVDVSLFTPDLTNLNSQIGNTIYNIGLIDGTMLINKT